MDSSSRRESTLEPKPSHTGRRAQKLSSPRLLGRSFITLPCAGRSLSLSIKDRSRAKAIPVVTARRNVATRPGDLPSRIVR
jgi:hypothetical protein